MRRFTFATLNLLLSAIFLGVVANLWADQVVGDHPSTYQPIGNNQKTIQNLNDFDSNRNTSYSDLQSHSRQLMHSVKTISDSNSIQTTPEIPTTISASAEPDSIASTSVENQSLIGHSQPHQCSPIPKDKVVYTRAGTCIQIIVNDSNRPLSDKERRAIFTALALLPTNHLSGITDITIYDSSTSKTPTSTKSNLVVVLPAKTTQSAISKLTTTAVGAHFFDWILTPKEQEDFLYGALPGIDVSYSVPNNQVFGLAYARYVAGGDSFFKGFPTDAFFPGDQNFLAQSLAIAAIFSLPGNPTQQGYYYKTVNGQISREIQPFSYGSTGIIRMGNYVFQLNNKGDAVTGWATVGHTPFHNYSRSTLLPLILKDYMSLS